jgi:predicted dehydrogenase
MKFLIIGRGSMAKRRCRNLDKLGYTQYNTWDITDDTTPKQLIETYKPEIIIVSSPPITKQQYIDMAQEKNIPCFVEADVCLYNGNYYPSSTMRFHPAVIKIKELIDNGTFGKIYSFTYHHGSHLDDWRPKGFPPDYYAAKKESSACKEMFCFELSWLSYLFGMPVDACGYVDKKLDMENVAADDCYSTVAKFEKTKLVQVIKPWDDRITKSLKNPFIKDENNTYSEKYDPQKPILTPKCHKCIMSPNSFYTGCGEYNIQCTKGTPDYYDENDIFKESKIFTTGTFQCDMVTRPTIRELKISAENGTLTWNWKDNFIDVIDWRGAHSLYKIDKGEAAPGYNSSIIESMYEDELREFIEAVKGNNGYRYSRGEEEAVIKMLGKVEDV